MGIGLTAGGDAGPLPAGGDGPLTQDSGGGAGGPFGFGGWGPSFIRDPGIWIAANIKLHTPPVKHYSYR